MKTFIVQATRIELQHPADTGSQQIHIEATPWGERLAHLLSATPQWEEGRWVVAHTSAVDARLRGLTDLLIALRYQHPTLLQLELTLTPAEEAHHDC
ncbi:MAG: hypothetical protein U9Q70_11005 [Chloroflexota bacterium]|nr:hypothetical protein [Chloroflexota bacterium]